MDPAPDYARVARHVTAATGETEVYRPDDDEAVRAAVDALVADGITLDEAVRSALITEIDAFLGDQSNPDDYSVEDVAKRARRAAGRTVSKTTKRRPMIVPMVRERGGKTTNSAR
ncbi:MAG: hypothetical protein IH940_09990 [Acidobacteria bacterium]|nr:hypothetical protein [Acidobacteriota bacterium]